MKRLEGKVAIVTGGTKGIGLAVTKLFVEEGAKVIACSRNNNCFDVDGAEYFQLDVSDDQSCRKLVDYVINKYGKIDILINNAGILKDRTTAKMTNEEFKSVINVNLNGTFYMTRLVGPIMQKNGYGSIVNLSSFVASVGNFGQANYVATKAGIEGMTKCWAKEFSRHGENVRVNAVAPGFIATDIIQDMPSSVLNYYIDKTILKRVGNPEEIGKAILFLASDDSSYITGTVLLVDGGISI